MPASAPPSPDAATSRAQIRMGALLLVFATFAAYFTSFGGPFIFDDKPAILDNATIRHLSNLSAVLTPPSNGSGVTGRPIVNFSLALNYAISGEAPWSYHAFNLIIHAFSALALFGIVRRTLLQPVISERLRAAALPLAFVIAALWALHPLLTESVTSVIQRTESLMGFFYLLTLYAFLRGVQSPWPAGWHVLAVVSCGVGMATKEVMVTAPIVVLAYDRTFVAGSLREALRQRGRFYLGLAATWLVLGYLVGTAGGTRGEAAGFGLGVTPWTYALTQCRALLLYLRLSFAPFPLVLDYGTAVVPRLSDVLPQAGVVLALLGATVWAWVKRPAAGFLAATFFVILAPSSSFLPLVSQTIAEHRMYLSLAAVVALIVTVAYSYLGRRALFVAAFVSVAFGAITALRNLDYRSEEFIWADTVRRVPENPRAHVNLAECLILLGRPAEALAPAQAAVELRPTYPEAQMNLGIALTQLGRPAEALDHSREAVRLKPNDPKAHSNLGATYFRLGRWSESVEQFDLALQLGPTAKGVNQIRNNLALALLQAGRVPEAIKVFERVLQVEPNLVETHFSLAVALGLAERLPEAAQHLETVLQLQPDHARAREALESVRKEMGR